MTPTTRKRPTTTLIILTRNEIAGVRAVLSNIPKGAADEVFAVDYDSTDGTAEYFRSHGIRVVRQVVPGRAEAFAIGVREAKGEYLVFFSPDGNEDPADISKLVALLAAGNDLAIASRFMHGARNEEDDQMFKFRAWANRAFTWLVRLAWGGRVTDSINGYRAIRKGAYERLSIDATGFAVEFQMTIRALKRGMRIAELPTREGNRIGGKSTSYAIPTGLQFIGVFLQEVILSWESVNGNTC